MIIKTNAKIRVRLESFNYELLKLSCQKITTILQNTHLNSIGNIPLPTRKRIYCVLRSPHVDKNSREHFEIRIYKRIVEVQYDPDLNVFDLLSEADLPAGVFYCLCLS